GRAPCRHGQLLCPQERLPRTPPPLLLQVTPALGPALRSSAAGEASVSASCPSNLQTSLRNDDGVAVREAQGAFDAEVAFARVPFGVEEVERVGVARRDAETRGFGVEVELLLLRAVHTA